VVGLMVISLSICDLDSVCIMDVPKIYLVCLKKLKTMYMFGVLLWSFYILSNDSTLVFLYWNWWEKMGALKIYQWKQCKDNSR
jgi:hypothetical protein